MTLLHTGVGRMAVLPGQPARLPLELTHGKRERVSLQWTPLILRGGPCAGGLRRAYHAGRERGGTGRGYAQEGAITGGSEHNTRERGARKPPPHKLWKAQQTGKNTFSA